MRNTVYSLFVAAIASVTRIEAAVNCEEAKTPVLIDSAGDFTTFPYLRDAIQITSQDTDTVTFSVAQLYRDTGTPMFAISYQDHGDVCDMEAYDDGSLIEYEYISSYTATCMHGFTQVGIYFYVGPDENFRVDDCDACQAPTNDYVAHYVRIPCECSPTCQPTPSPTVSTRQFSTPEPTPSCGGPDCPTPEPTPSCGGPDCPTPEPTPSCGGEGCPSESPSVSPSESPSVSPTESPSASPTKTPTASPTNSPSTSPSDSPTKAPTESPSAAPSGSPTKAPSAAPSKYPTKSPTDSPSTSPTKSPTKAPTDEPSASPSASPSSTPSVSPTDTPTASPSASPSGSYYPSNAPSESPTVSSSPTVSPTGSPSVSPTKTPTDSPSATPSVDLQRDFPEPTKTPDCPPTQSPTVLTKQAITPEPTPTCGGPDCPTPEPTPTCGGEGCPSESPSASPSDSPSASPTGSPTVSRSESPSASPTKSPTVSPTKSPSVSPSESPTVSPSASPTATPTDSPSASPSGSYFPSNAPSNSPSLSSSPSESPSASPSDSPSASPTGSPTASPSVSPTVSPSESPTVLTRQAITPEPTPTCGGPDCPTPEPTPTCGGEGCPSESPSASPSQSPTGSPTTSLSGAPSVSLSKSPTASPTDSPSASPIGSPSASPTKSPSDSPSTSPTVAPTESPTVSPTSSPSASPSGSFYPSNAPTGSPTTESPSKSPTQFPTWAPTDTWYPTTVSPTSNIDRFLPPDECGEPVKSKLVYSVGNDSAFPDFQPPITVLTQYVENVTFAVEQVFSDVQVGMMGVGYTRSGSSEVACEAEQMVDFGNKIEVSAQCNSGFAEATLYLYTGDSSNFTLDQTEVCTLPNHDEYVAYYYKIPCTSACKPKVPDCLVGPVVTYTDIGDENEICLYDEMPIMIEKGKEGSHWVNFTVDNTWSSTGMPEHDITSASISYISKTGEPVCQTFDAFPDKFETTGVLQALCEDGLSKVVVNIHSDGIIYEANEISNECMPPENIGTCAYEIILPCDSTVMCETESPSAVPTISPSDIPTPTPSATPTASPSVSPSAEIIRSFPTTESPTADSCPYSDAEFVDIDGATMYPEMPVKINYQNTTHVGFTVENTFGGTISSVYTQYQTGSFGQSECLQEQNVEETVSIDFVAQCVRHTKLAIVNVWMSDCSTTETSFLEGADSAEIPECCYASEECKTVQYTFKLPCEPEPCPEDDRATRRLESIRDEFLNQAKAPIATKLLDSAPSQASRHEAVTIPSFRDRRSRHSDASNLEDHFCVQENYPCGENGDKVHVCHYSAKDGYTTICLTEEESDAVRFFPKDYCGPCVGGFASV